MQINTYIEEVLSQPRVLREGVRGYDPGSLDGVIRDLKAGAFDRIILTGMGASYFGSYAAWMRLVQAGLPAWWIDTSELLHYTMPLITPRTLLWVISQSGMSVEIQALLARLENQPPAVVLGTTNDPESSLGKKANVVLPLYSGEERTVSTRSYVNTLAITQMAAVQMTGAPLDVAREGLFATADGLEEYFSRWDNRVEAWIDSVHLPERLMFLGRGSSLASAEMAALMLKEAAKFESEAMSAAEFRHGPLELADERLTVILIEGDPEARAKNQALARELQRHQAHVIWMGEGQAEGTVFMPLPKSPRSGKVITEIAPLQLLSIGLAGQTGIEPGIFRYIGKVTLVE